MIIKPIRTALPYVGIVDDSAVATDYDTFVNILKNATTEDKITKMLGWKSSVTADYLAQLTNADVADIEAAATTLTAATTPKITIS